MGCPSIGILGQNLTFSLQAATTPTGNVSYAVYEDATTTEILTGNMTVDFGSKVGFCLATIACTTANGFERYKSYTIRITGTVAGVAMAKGDFAFLCLGGEDIVTATTGALTSSANFKSYAGITSSDDDTLIGYLISRATSAIEGYCDRTLRSSSYRERYNGDGTNTLLLREYPVTAITLLGTTVTDAIKITNSSTDAWNARITVTDTAITLIIDGGANAGTDSLTLASYTLTTLITAINALSKGWSASLIVSTYGIYDADEILPCSGLQCTPNLSREVYLKVPDDLEYDFVIEGQTASPYKGNNGTVYLSQGWADNWLGEGGNARHQNITIRYTAGYETTPADLEQICIDLVNIYYRGRVADLSLKAESLGDHSKTFADDARDLPAHIAKRLAPYKRHR